jgi:toxin ParE1/3/4
MARSKRLLLWSPDADHDLFLIWRAGADTWSPDVADKHLREIKLACDRLLRDPKLGRARDELSAGIRSTLVDPHVVFYRVTTSAIEIVRVMHQHEDIEIIFY